MNQENGPVFEPTLPEGVTYKDLNDAHDADMKDGGDREEKMYPTPVAQIDNSRAYSNLMTQAKTRDLLEGLRRELQPNEGNPDEKSNFDMRTGDDELTRASIEKRMNKREEFFKKQDDQLNELLDLISRTKNVAQVAEKLRWAEDDARNGLISGEGLNNIREVAAQRTLDLTTELHARNFNELLDLISKTKNVAQVAEKLGWAEDDARDGKISEIQLLRIRQAASSRENELNEDI